MCRVSFRGQRGAFALTPVSTEHQPSFLAGHNATQCVGLTRKKTKKGKQMKWPSIAWLL